jgi:hypothetical protein
MKKPAGVGMRPFEVLPNLLSQLWRSGLAAEAQIYVLARLIFDSLAFEPLSEIRRSEFRL